MIIILVPSFLKSPYIHTNTHTHMSLSLHIHNWIPANIFLLKITFSSITHTTNTNEEEKKNIWTTFAFVECFPNWAPPQTTWHQIDQWSITKAKDRIVKKYIYLPTKIKIKKLQYFSDGGTVIDMPPRKGDFSWKRGVSLKGITFVTTKCRPPNYFLFPPLLRCLFGDFFFVLYFFF